MHIQFQSVNLIGKEHLVDLGVAVNVILKSITEKLIFRMSKEVYVIFNYWNILDSYTTKQFPYL